MNTPKIKELYLQVSYEIIYTFMSLLGKRMLVWVPHQQDFCASTWAQVYQNTWPTAEGSPNSQGHCWAEARLQCWSTLGREDQNLPHSESAVFSKACHTGARGGESRASAASMSCERQHSMPRATEKMHGVWIPTKLAGKSGALLLSLVKLKQLWKHLAEGCRCLQMERQLKAGLDWGICSFTEPPSGTDGRAVLERMQFQYLTTYDCTNIKYQH